MRCSALRCIVEQRARNSQRKLLGTCNVVLKVTVSCLAAVLTDRYTKQFKDPVYVHRLGKPF